MLHDIKDRWTKDGIFAHAVKQVDPDLQLRSATLFTECQGEPHLMPAEDFLHLLQKHGSDVYSLWGFPPPPAWDQHRLVGGSVTGFVVYKYEQIS